MKKNTEKYENNLLNDLQDADEAVEYLNAALEDGYPEVFLMALKDVANAKGISKLACEAGMNREHLYKILSTKGNPKLNSLSAILNSLGLRLSVKVAKYA
jgi:probable addiction module antidote protein